MKSPNQIIRRASEPNFSNVFGSVTGRTEGGGKGAGQIFVDEESGHLRPDSDLFVRS